MNKLTTEISNSSLFVVASLTGSLLLSTIISNGDSPLRTNESIFPWEHAIVQNGYSFTDMASEVNYVVLENFVDKFLKNSYDLDERIVEMVDEHFWDLM
jgi:hypothetical protein